METSPLGAFFMRPVCRAECLDPSLVAVDVGLQRRAGDGSGHDAGRHGMSLVASLARPWLSAWGGYPSLVQSESVVPRSDRQGGGMVASFGSWSGWGAWHAPRYRLGDEMEPDMRCVRDVGSSVSWQSLWAQREPTSRADVWLTLSFDRSYWPAA